MKRGMLDKLIAKARYKKDGVYSCQGYPYKVRSGHVVAFIEDHTIHGIAGIFTYKLTGRYRYKDDVIRVLKRDKSL